MFVVFLFLLLCFCVVMLLSLAKPTKTETKKKHPQKSGSTSGYFFTRQVMVACAKVIAFFFLLFSCFFACCSKNTIKIGFFFDFAQKMAKLLTLLFSHFFLLKLCFFSQKSHSPCRKKEDFWKTTKHNKKNRKKDGQVINSSWPNYQLYSIYIYIYIYGNALANWTDFCLKISKKAQKNSIFFKKMAVQIWPPNFYQTFFWVMSFLFSLLLLFLFSSSVSSFCLLPLLIFVFFFLLFLVCLLFFCFFFFFFRQVIPDLCCLVAWILLHISNYHFLHSPQ